MVVTSLQDGPDFSHVQHPSRWARVKLLLPYTLSVPITEASQCPTPPEAVEYVIRARGVRRRKNQSGPSVVSRTTQGFKK